MCIVIIHMCIMYNVHVYMYIIIQGPVVSVGCPSLQYGLMQLGHTSSKVLTLTNESMCTANFELKQATASQTESEREILVSVTDYMYNVLSMINAVS